MFGWGEGGVGWVDIGFAVENDIMKLIGEIKGPIIGGRLGLFIIPSAPPIITNEVRPPTTRPHLPHPPD